MRRVPRRQVQDSGGFRWIPVYTASDLKTASSPDSSDFKDGHLVVEQSRHVLLVHCSIHKLQQTRSHTIPSVSV